MDIVSETGLVKIFVAMIKSVRDHSKFMRNTGLVKFDMGRTLVCEA